MSAGARIRDIQAELRQIADQSTQALITQGRAIAAQAQALSEMEAAPIGVRTEAANLARHLQSSAAIISRVWSNNT